MSTSTTGNTPSGTALGAALAAAGIDGEENALRAALSRWFANGGSARRAREIVDLCAARTSEHDGSRTGIESHSARDPVMTPAKAGGPAARSGSQQRVESHEISDPVSAPPRSKISKSAAAAVAKTIWDRRLGVSDVVLKTATKHHFQTLDRKGIAMQHVARRFLTEIAWPDDHTPLPRCASAAQVTAILDSAHDVLDAMGLTRPPPRPAVERGHAAQ